MGKFVALPLPDITLRNHGKAKGDMPPRELGQEIAQALKQKLSTAISFDTLAKSAGQALDMTGSTIKGLFGKTVHAGGGQFAAYRQKQKRPSEWRAV